MRKSLIFILLAASVAMPAMAQDSGDNGRQRRDRGGERGSDRGSERGSDDGVSAQRDEARSAARAERPERPSIMQRAVDQSRGDERQQAAPPQQPQYQQQQVQQPQAQHSQPQERVRGDGRRGDERRGGEWRGGERGGWGQRQPGDDGTAAALERQRRGAATLERGQVVPQGYDRRQGRIGDGSIIGRAIEQSRGGTGDVRNPGEVRNPGDGGDRYRRHHSGSTAGWSNQWRNDRSYDWRHYRDRNRSTFRLGNYWDPYGSSYRRFSIGFSIWPSYYQSNYWLDDPWMYRLPQTYGPYRWVRYYDDALLVNVYTGQVVDVVYSFFW